MVVHSTHRKGCDCKPCVKWWRLLRHEIAVDARNKQQYLATVRSLGSRRILYNLPKQPPTPFTQIKFRYLA